MNREDGRCPSCGASLNPFSPVCPSCGEDILQPRINNPGEGKISPPRPPSIPLTRKNLTIGGVIILLIAVIVFLSLDRNQSTLAVKTVVIHDQSTQVSTIVPIATLTPTPLPTPTPTPSPVTYHLTGVVNICRLGNSYRSALQLTLIIDRTTVSGHMSLNKTGPGEGDGDINGSIDANNYLDFDSGAVITFHWNGTLSAQHTITDGTMYPIEGRCGDATGTWTAS